MGGMVVVKLFFYHFFKEDLRSYHFMEKPSVYLETSFVSYLTAKPSRNLIVAAHQSITSDWWENQRQLFDLFISQVVVDEAKLGDPQAAAKRLTALEGITHLDVSEEIIIFAGYLIDFKAIPKNELRDAYHLSVACVHGINYLLTWNCKHLANASIREKIEETSTQFGYRIPIICTPEELLGEF